MANPNFVEAGKKGFPVKRVVAAAVIVLIVLIVLFNSFTTVQAGHSGVVTTFGKVSDVVLSEGLHFKTPFVQEIVVVDNRVQKAEADCSSASKDLQTVTSTIAVNYNVVNASSARLYKEVGLDYEAIIINPAIQECVKAVTAQFTAEELITNRQKVGDMMSGLLTEKISSYGVQIQIFNIITFEFTDEYNAAIEAKQTAQQNALKAEQDLQRIKVEAEQTITEAEAEAEAYKLKSQEITPEIILMSYIDKWDGKLPTVTSGDGGNMMLDLTSLLAQVNKSASGTVTSAVTENPPVVSPAEVEETEEADAEVEKS